jgi:hypothetical protein
MSKELERIRTEEVAVYFKTLAHFMDYNFACRSVWVRNLVFNIKGGT